jgi:hypothetical protein
MPELPPLSSPETEEAMIAAIVLHQRVPESLSEEDFDNVWTLEMFKAAKAVDYPLPEVMARWMYEDGINNHNEIASELNETVNDHWPTAATEGAITAYEGVLKKWTRDRYDWKEAQFLVGQAIPPRRTDLPETPPEAPQRPQRTTEARM